MKWTTIVLSAILAVVILMWAHERDSRHNTIVSSVIGITALCKDGMYSTATKKAGSVRRAWRR